jgi:EEF1A lysine methyltransferase 4
MTIKQPSYGEQSYWEERFTANPTPFEWLEAPTVLDPYLASALKETGDSDAQLLHIGCGTSHLSHHLRSHVEDPRRIHNVDYSNAAVAIGRAREAQLFARQQTNETSTMRWSATNLLDHASLLSACQPTSYSVIVDKSTSDSVACSDDVHVPLPYHVTTSKGAFSRTDMSKSFEPIHPVHILAVHLALLAKPKARWVSLSYSEDRFPFLPKDSAPASSESFHDSPDTQPSSSPASECDEAGHGDNTPDNESLAGDLDDIPQEIIKKGFPNPSRLWRLVGKHEVEPPPEDTQSHGGLSQAHRPKVFHWVFVLERTDVELFVR